MSKYQVKFYTGSYKSRQQAANRDKAVCYVEHHFNSSASQSADYTVVIVGSNASNKSILMARNYAERVSARFGTRTGGASGVKIGGYDGRGNGNVKYTAMPAMLLEPLFASNPKRAEIIRSHMGQEILAQCLIDTIVNFFPDGGLVAFSVGHKYKSQTSTDKGAPLHGGGYEADYAEIILKLTAEKLERSE